MRILSTSAGLFFLALAIPIAGCRTNSAARSGPAPDIDAAIAQASAAGKPLFILVLETGAGPADKNARVLLESLFASGAAGGARLAVLDIAVSRNRASAARFHPTNTPVLFGLSPRGVIITINQDPLTSEGVKGNLWEVARRAPAIDARLGALEAAARGGRDPGAELALAEFLAARGNAREAIPHFDKAARAESADLDRRVRAWAGMVMARFWVAEPEKGRHEARELIDTLGPKAADALAAGQFLLGTQDANAKRFKLAREEFEKAMAAAPNSDYAARAARALAALSTGRN